jgi:outer membrane protein assembly factor BamB
MRPALLIGTLLVLLSLLLTACSTASLAQTTTKISSLSANPMNVSTPDAKSSTGEWPTYLANNARSGFNKMKTKAITTTSAPKLKQLWSYDAKHPISTQPVEANGMIYWGDWFGNEHATDLSGHEVWLTNLGTTTHPEHHCEPVAVGVASTATVATVSINGTKTPVVFVGGGDHNMYALNATNGSIIWKTALGSSPVPSNSFIWSSPAFFQGSIYVGVASFGDCPDVPGQLVQLNATTGAIKHIFKTVPNDQCAGDGVWGSPTIDEAKKTVYFATGENSACKTKEPYAFSVIEVRASDLSLVGAWQVPGIQQGDDTDFGNTPTLFQVSVNGVKHQLVGIASKDGSFYAFGRDALDKGLVWSDTIAQGGTCGECGDGSISPAAWDGTHLYVAGGHTTINGMPCQGSLRALNPANGAFVWEKCMLDGPVLGAVTVAPGIVVAEDGHELVVVDSKSGKTLFTYKEPGARALFYAAPSISAGVLYAANMDGKLYAFGS